MLEAKISTDDLDQVYALMNAIDQHADDIQQRARARAARDILQAKDSKYDGHDIEVGANLRRSKVSFDPSDDVLFGRSSTDAESD